MPRSWTTALCTGIAAAVLACGPGPSASAREEGRTVLEGEVRASLGGDVFLFLGEAQALSAGMAGAALPRVTAVPKDRRARGDHHFVFADVEPGRWDLFGFVDVDGSARLDVDVLAQPDEGDLLLPPVEITLEEGARERLNREASLRARESPPRVTVVGREGQEVMLGDQPTTLVSLTLAASAGLHVHLVDADGDGRADDANGDGLPELWPRTFLRFLPRPGQTVPVDAGGRRAEVILPLIPDPLATLLPLGGDVSRRLRLETLQVLVWPQAQALWLGEDGSQTMEALGAIPVGEWELVLLTSEGRFWRLPNALGAEDAGQATRFRVVHGSGEGG